ncbi:MMPL family transporter [Streptomyces sp. NPDC023588]|uniref:MMPL family transporter n=1 Tax=Streptomyces sp. NPDC023588 TaxID=3154907 RepID=UPI0033F96228
MCPPHQLGIRPRSSLRHRIPGTAAAWTWTASAALMCVVFIGFATGQLMVMKQLATALAIAVAVDATLVRCLLVPATMTTLRTANWCAPRALRRTGGKPAPPAR